MSGLAISATNSDGTHRSTPSRLDPNPQTKASRRRYCGQQQFPGLGSTDEFRRVRAEIAKRLIAKS